MLHRDAVVTMELVNSIVHAGGGEPLFLSRTGTAADDVLENLFSKIAGIPDIMRANVYRENRSIIWSSDPEFIDVEFNTNPDLDRAFLGELVVEEGVVGEVRKAEHAFLEGNEKMGARFIEAYIPVSSLKGEEIIGVVEVYKSPEALLDAVDAGKRLVWLTATVGGLILYLVLFWIVKRTSRVILEQQDRLVANETMAAIGEMSSAVAHGLRNPLASIRSSAELALHDTSETATREALTDVVTQADRLEAWIRELLTGTRPTSVELEPLDIGDLLEDCLNGYEGTLSKRGIAISLDIKEVHPLIKGNRIALRQVFNSLLSNAVEAMPSGGSLAVSSTLDGLGQSVLVRIVDSGVGIPDGQASRLMEAFVTTKGDGVGIGLTLARRIVERHGGELKICPANDGGTEASVQLPLELHE